MMIFGGKSQHELQEPQTKGNYASSSEVISTLTYIAFFNLWQAYVLRLENPALDVGQKGTNLDDIVDDLRNIGGRAPDIQLASTYTVHLEGFLAGNGVDPDHRVLHELSM